MAARRPDCNCHGRPARNWPPVRAWGYAPTVPRRLVVDDAIDLYLVHLKAERHLSPHTLDGYGRDLNRLARRLADAGRDDITAVTIADITDHLAALAAGKLSPRSRARALVAIRGLFRHLVAERYLDADPTELVDAPKSARQLPGVLGEAAVAELIAMPPDTPRGRRDAAMIELVYASGLRVSELVNLPHADVNLHLGFVRVTGKGRKTRLVPLHATARARLTRYLEDLRRGRRVARPAGAVRDRARRRDDAAGLLEAAPRLRARRRHPAAER